MSVAGGVLKVVMAGVVPYDRAVALQERVRLAREEGRIPDTLLLLAHPPVITLGRAARGEHLLVSPELLEQRGIQVREAARGGDVTYHGPGQLVGYPVVHLGEHGKDVHRYLRCVEEALIRVLGRYGVTGKRLEGLTGVWVGDEKVAAIGVGVRRWVTWHGFALNVSTGLDAFRLIVPCGIRNRGVTSLARLTGRSISEEEVASAAAEELGDVLGLRPVATPLEALLAEAG